MWLFRAGIRGQTLHFALGAGAKDGRPCSVRTLGMIARGAAENAESRRPSVLRTSASRHLRVALATDRRHGRPTVVSKDPPSSSPFSDPAAIARYAEGPVRQVPGFDALQKMTTILRGVHVQRLDRLQGVSDAGALRSALGCDGGRKRQAAIVDDASRKLSLYVMMRSRGQRRGTSVKPSVASVQHECFA